jgi:hypothetical protein
MEFINIKIIRTFVIAVCTHAVCAAELTEWRKEADIPLNKCNLETIVGFYLINNSRIQAEFATATIPLLNEQRKLVDKVPNKNKSVGEQFNKEDFSKFNAIREKMMSINLKQLTESNRLRDMEMMEKMTQVADRNYRFSTELDEKNSEYIYQLALYGLRVYDDMNPYKSVEIDTKNCSFDLAIATLQDEPSKVMNSINVDELFRKMQSLANRNNMKKIDRTKLSTIDKKEYDKLMEEYRPFDRSATFYKDLNNIGLMNKSSVVIYDSLRRDFDIYGSSNDYGKTLKNLKIKKLVDERTLQTIELIENLSMKIPSEMSKSLASRADYVKGLDKK